MEKIDDARFDLGNHPSANFGIAQLIFRLRFENGGFELHRNGSREALAHIEPREVVFVKLIDPFEHSLAKRRKVGPAVAGGLAIDK